MADQITTHFHQVFGVILPPSFLSLQNRLEVLNLNIFALPGLHMQCYGLPSFASQLLLRAIVPALLIGATILYHRLRGEPVKALPSSLWITFLTFSLVSWSSRSSASLNTASLHPRFLGRPAWLS